MIQAKYQCYTFLIFCLFLIAGCATGSNSSRFYLMNSLHGEGVGKNNTPLREGASIGIGPITLSDYLDRPHIVVRDTKNRLYISDFDRWASNLEENITNVLAEDLEALLRTDSVFTYPWIPSFKLDYSVAVNVIRFDGMLDGDITLRAQWIILRESEKKVMLTRIFNVSEKVAGRDYGSMISAMSKALAKLSLDIADSLKEFIR